MTIEVRGPDGTINQFPDGTPDSVIEGALRQHYGAQDAQPEQSTFDRALNSPIGIGARQGISDAINIPKAVGGLGDAALKWGADKLGVKDFDPSKSAVAAVLNPMGNVSRMMPDQGYVDMALYGDFNGPPEPANKQDQYTRAAARGVTGTLAMGGASPMALMSGASAALGGEYAKDAFPDSKWAPLLGGLAAGGGVAGLYNVLRPTAGGVARGFLQGIDETTLENGRNLQKSAMDQFLGPLTPGQALNNRGLLQVERLTEQSPQGGAMQTMYDQRGPAAFNAVAGQVADITGGMSPREGQKAVQSGAGGAIKTATQARTNYVKPFYDAARTERAPDSILAPIFADIDTQVAQVGPKSDAGRALLQWRDKIASTATNGEASIGQLDTLYKEFRDSIKRPSIAADSLKGAEASSGGILGRVAETVGDTTANASNNIAVGRGGYQAMTLPVDALKKGLVGDIARSKTLQRAAAVFTNPANETPQDIYNAANAIRAQNKQALPALVGQHIDGTLQASAKSTRKDPSRVGGQFSQDILGELDTNQAQNLEAAIKTLPDGITRWKAFERLNDVLRAQGRRLQAGSPTAQNADTMRQLSEPNAVIGGAARLATGPLNTATDWLKSARLSGNFSTLADVFSAPDSIDQLRQLAREPNIRRAEVIVNGLLTADRAAQAE